MTYIDESDSGYGYPTCRTFPRTTSECFADERAVCIYRHSPNRGHGFVTRFCAIGIVVMVALLLTGAI